MRVLVACRKFDGVVGGVERMSTTLMNELVTRGHEVSLFTWDEHEEAKAFYTMDSRIRWIKLAMGNPAQTAGFKLRLKRAMKVRRILKELRPDVVLGFQEGSFVTLKLYGLGLGIPMICAIRESPFRYAHIPASPPFWFSCQIFRLSAAITVQIERYRLAFPEFLWPKIKAIPNHVMPALNRADPAADVQDKIILATGRLSPEKNHRVLIDAFSRLADKFPDWKLVIVGRGGEAQKLQAQINALPMPIRDRVELAGVSDDIPSWLLKAHIFCLPSRWEGFPNSLAEAMAHGLPVVGFRQCDGVCDLIEDGKTGYLAEGIDNSVSLAEHLSRLMQSPAARKEMGEAAYQASLDFQPAKIFDQWEKLLQEASGK